MSFLIEAVYSKLAYVDSFVSSDQDIQRILTGGTVQESMNGITPNALALDEIRQYMEIRARQHMAVTMAHIQKRYQSAPYGWREIDIAALVATLIRGQKIQLIYNSAAMMPTDRKMVDCLRKRTELDKTVVRLRVSAGDGLLKKARELGSELFNTMDLKSDEENLCGQLTSLLDETKKKNDALLVYYSGAIAYPGKNVVESGKRQFDAILAKRSDNVAFLEAFTQSEDALLDWSEDVREVEFFFKSQKMIFDAAWKLCAEVQKEKHYFMDEADALNAAKGMQEILKNAKPYRRIAELPALQQTINAAYGRINDARRSRVEEIIIQARGDIHTLAGNDLDLRDTIRKADDELERRRNEALNAESPTLLDAAITQILTYKDSVCRQIELILANKVGPKPPKLKINTLRRYDVLPQKRLSSPDEINAYVEALRTTLLDALKENDAIQLN